MCKDSRLKIYIPRILPLSLALAYLLVPNVLFLLEIFRPLYALPLSACLLASVVYVCRCCIKSWGECKRRVVCDVSDCFALLLALLLALLITELIGFNGHIQQTGDMVFRNAMYQTLVDQPWPVFSNTGDFFVYYHAYWLPPAFLSKCLAPMISPNTALFMWYFSGLAILILTAFVKLRGRVLLFFTILCLLGSCADIFFAVQQVLPMVQPHFPGVQITLPSWWAYLTEGRETMRYGAFWGNVLFTYNAGAPMMPLLGLLLSGLLPLRLWHIPVSFTVSMSPMACIGLLPLLGCKFLRKPQEIKAVLTDVTLWVCILLVAACGLYFTELTESGNDATQVCWLWDANPTNGTLRGGVLRMSRCAVMTLGIVIPAFLLLRKRIRSNVWFISIMIGVFVFPCIWVGRHDNIFPFKAGLIINTIFAWLLTAQWRAYGIRGRMVISVVVLLSSLHVALFMKNQRVWAYSWNSDVIKRNIADEWGGHMNHQDDYHYKNFFGSVKYPCLQYDKPGESFLAPQ